MERIKNIITYLQAIDYKKLWQNWNELVVIPIAIVLWLYSDSLLRWMDPTSATFDSGIMQIYLFAIIGLLFFSGFSWLYLKLNWPLAYEYLSTEFEDDLWSLEPKYRSALFLFLFFLPFILLVVLANAL